MKCNKTKTLQHEWPVITNQLASQPASQPASNARHGQGHNKTDLNQSLYHPYHARHPLNRTIQPKPSNTRGDAKKNAKNQKQETRIKNRRKKKNNSIIYEIVIKSEKYCNCKKKNKKKKKEYESESESAFKSTSEYSEGKKKRKKN